MQRYVKEAAQKGLTAAKKNLIPGLILQALAVTLILLYYRNTSFASYLDQLGQLNVSWYPWFAIVTTMVFGGLIPLIIEANQTRREGRTQRSIGQLILTLVVWGVNGYLTALFYNMQASIFGANASAATVIKKVIVDQFVWVPIYVVPFFTYIFLWRDCHFSLPNLKQALEQKSFLSRGLPLMISNWAVWIPAVSVIYAFPVPLQMVLMNLILVFWSLMLTIFIKD